MSIETQDSGTTPITETVIEPPAGRHRADLIAGGAHASDVRA